ncbi:MAG: pyridoxal-phosphate dependent enzyme [Bacteroidia bacterium]
MARKKIYNNILETIGDTPLVRINNITKDVKATVLAKIETVNPGNSIKDRMAVKMIEDAERSGALKPGGTIIEGTSGNTGMGLAIAAVIKGYKCIFTSTDKQSKEKFDALRAFGADVIVCPTNVEPEDPRSYYSVSSRLVNEVQNSWKPNQYDNPSNAAAHYESTGPEIWEQTDGKVDHLIVGVGTGGTISGTAKYLKEKNPNLKVWGIDTYGSLFKKYKETGILDNNEVYPYITEGIGEDFLPKNVDFSLIDHFEKVTDRDAAIMTRRIPREEGIFAGNSAGSAMAGLMQLKDNFKEGEVVVVIFHDHGTRYLGKMFNEEWMRDRGFIDTKPTARNIIESRKNYTLQSVNVTSTVDNLLKMIMTNDYSQIPVMQDGAIVGAIHESSLLMKIVANPSLKLATAQEVMDKPFPYVSLDTTAEAISTMITKEVGAVMTKDALGNEHIITKHDIIKALCNV